MCESHTHAPEVKSTAASTLGSTSALTNQNAVSSGNVANVLNGKPAEKSASLFLDVNNLQTYIAMNPNDRYTFIIHAVAKAYADRMAGAYGRRDKKTMMNLTKEMGLSVLKIKDEIFGIVN